MTEKKTAFSKLKPREKFWRKWEEHGLGGGDPVPEYVFDSSDDSRNWRFDFAWPKCKVAVEIDGFGYGHQAMVRLTQNHEKQNAAVEQGWRVFRYTSKQLGSHAATESAVEQVCRLLTRAKPIEG